MSTSVKTLREHSLSCTILSSVLVVGGITPAHALPTGGSVVGGAATLSYGTNTLNVNQTSNRTIVDFDTFNVGANERVKYAQPNSGSVALNRVTGNNAAQILGAIDANGTVIISDPHGVLFGAGAQVNVGGLVATSSNVSNADFMNGNDKFTIAGDPNATVSNAGKIRVTEGGLAALVGPNVTNSGLIEAKLGKVQLASGDTFAIDLYGDGLLSLQASDKLKKQLVENSGKIAANGGHVLLTAAAAEGEVNSLINMTGLIQANSVGSKNGHVVLLAAGTKNQGSTVLVSGTVTAKGKAKAATGGTIDVLADNVGLLSGSTLDASGVNGGGTIRVGGDFHGAGPVPNAAHTVVESGATLLANAGANGNGGNIAVWADQSTVFDGTIEAKGGSLSGNGGFVETSGKDILQSTGSVDASAANGQAGTWLLDPRDVTITTTTTGGTYASNIFTPTSNNSTVNYTTIQTSLNGGSNVLITTGSTGTQNGDITVAHDVTKTSGNDATLTLQAANDIIFNDNVNISSTHNKLNVLLLADSDHNGHGDITFGSGSSITSNNGNITLSSNTLDNDSGSHVLNAGTGRWLIYLNSPNDSNDYGDLDSHNTAIWNTSYTGGSVSQSGNRYLFAYQPTLTFTTGNLTKTYGVNNTGSLTSDYTVSGVQSGVANAYLGDSSATAFSGAAAVTSTGAAATAHVAGSPYAINITQGTLASTSGYAFAFHSTGKLTVNPAALSITANNKSMTYGDGNSFNGFSTSGLQNGESIGSVHLTTNATTSSSGNWNAKSTPWTITASGATGGTFTSGDYAITYHSGSLSIAKRVLAVLATGVNKTYDGTTGATVTLSDNKIAGDHVTDSYTSASFSDKNAGNGKTVHVNGIGISGSDAGNYTLANSTTTTLADIFKRLLFVDADGLDKTYDGTTTASVILSDNSIYGDHVTDHYTTATFSDKNAGNHKTVTVTGISITGSDAGNYTLAHTTDITTADICRRDLFVDADGLNKTYDGTTTATVILSDNRIAGDQVTDHYTSANFFDKNAGNHKLIFVNGISISGTDAGNYNLVNSFDFTSADIFKRALTIVASALDKVYDGTTDATVTLSDNRIAGDHVTDHFTTASFSDKNVGNDKTVTVGGLSITGSDAHNYILTNTGATALADITPYTLVVSANDIMKVYGTVDPALTYTYGTLQGSDTASVFTGGLVRVAGEHVAGGPYAILQGTLSAGSNYTIAYTPGTFTITPYTLNVTADNKSVITGHTLPPLTYTYGALQNGDDASIFSGTLATVPSNSLPGNYPITQGTLAATMDYTIDFSNGTLTVKAPQADINATDRTLNFPANGLRTRFGLLLAMLLPNQGGNNAPAGGGLANLAPAAGGDDAKYLSNLSPAAGGDVAQFFANLAPAAGGKGNIVSLIECTDTSNCGLTY